MFHRGSRIAVVGFFLVFLLAAGVTAPQGFAQSRYKSKSGHAGIFLRATLAQSLSFSVLPHGVPFNSLVSTDVKAEFPLTVKANWVRGPGSVSVAVFFSDDLLRDRNVPLDVQSSTSSDSTMPGLSVDSVNLPRPEPGKNEVMTIRAQAI